MALGAAALGVEPTVHSAEKVIQGFEKAPDDPDAAKSWKPFSDRKLRVGIVGYGVCKFGAEFGFQNHPNVEVAAVSDLFPDRCAELARICRCPKTYPSLEELVKDDRLEAVFVATDAPSHPRHCIEVLKHGKHVASAVPAVFGSLAEADELFAAVKSSSRKYMMFETSFFHDDLYAMRQIYAAGGLGKWVYSEGEYYHYMEEPIASYKDWRVGLPPQWSRACPAGSLTCSRPTIVTRTHSARKSRCFAPARAGCHAWQSVGTPRAIAARWGASGGRKALSTGNTRDSKRRCQTQNGQRCLPVWPRAAMAVRTGIS
ncbi:MAG: Gfo/Idh/MocA family oxidoreductase [Verrucomicrobia bacterium]|nr:Gfo/Idh/MocA family oxidoreductase [Verrucomicrobiota bacterium]